MNQSPAELREWAARCDEKAACAVSEAERTILLRKSEALRALADSEDWLLGKMADGSNALAAAR